MSYLLSCNSANVAKSRQPRKSTQHGACCQTRNYRSFAHSSTMHAVINKKHQNRQSATDKAAMLHFQESHHSVVNSTGSLAVNDYTNFRVLRLILCWMYYTKRNKDPWNTVQLPKMCKVLPMQAKMATLQCT